MASAVDVSMALELDSDFPSGDQDLVPAVDSDLVPAGDSDLVPAGDSDFVPAMDSDFPATDSNTPRVFWDPDGHEIQIQPGI